MQYIYHRFYQIMLQFIPLKLLTLPWPLRPSRPDRTQLSYYQTSTKKSKAASIFFHCNDSHHLGKMWAHIHCVSMTMMSAQKHSRMETASSVESKLIHRVLSVLKRASFRFVSYKCGATLCFHSIMVSLVYLQKIADVFYMKEEKTKEMVRYISVRK